MTSCTDLKNDEDVEEEKLEDSPKGDDKTRIVSEALPAHMGWRQIFCLLEEMYQCVATTLYHSELYVGRVKDVGESSKGLTQYTTCNTAITFTNDDLLLALNLTIVPCL